MSDTNGTKPACLDAINKTRVLLACDFAEHVLPIWYEYYPDDNRPKEAIEAARKYVTGKIKKFTLDKARSAAWSAAEDAAWAVAAAAAEDAAWAVVAAAASAAWSAAWAVAGAETDVVAWSEEAVEAAAAEAAEAAAYRHADSVGGDPDSAKAAEKKWQAARAVKVVEAIESGEDPWGAIL